MSSIITDEKKIDAILERGVVANVLPSKKLLKKRLLSGEQLRFYIGIDPTATSLHIGHGQNILVLEEFRQLGHKVFLVIGDFTARVGDPTDKDASRSVLSAEEIESNTQSIVAQLKNIIDTEDATNPAEVVYNASWLGGLTFGDLLGVAAEFTVQQLLERDMFERRLAQQKPIYLNEFLYPIMQGYDSVALDIDVEIGGTDQLFNMLAGRTLLKRLKNKEKCVITLNLLQNPSTGEMMSKSTGTGVMLDASPAGMFGQLMAQPDEMVRTLLIGNTRLPLSEVEEIVKQVEGGGTTARDAKLRTAQEVVALYRSPAEAEEAQKEFLARFSGGQESSSVAKLYTHTKKEDTLLNLLDASSLVSSRTEGRRLIQDSAVEIDGETITDEHATVDLSSERVVRVGKHRFIRMDS